LGIAPSIEGPGILPSPVGALIVPALDGESTRPLLSVVVPTFNEIENLCEFLTAVRSTLDAALPGDYEVIVVDDDSPDRTWEAAAAMTTGFPQLRVVRRCQERGLARAVIRGWQVARGAVLGTINADFQHPPEMLARIFALKRKLVEFRRVAGGMLLTLGSGLLGMGFVGALMQLGRGVEGPQGFDPPKIVPMTAFLAIGCLTLAGVIAGLYPARKAAMMQPVEALRQE